VSSATASDVAALYVDAYAMFRAPKKYYFVPSGYTPPASSRRRRLLTGAY
jgi:hypothetical protein